MTIRLDEHTAAAKGRPLAIHLAVASLRVLESYREALGDIDRISLVAAVAALQVDQSDAGRAHPGVARTIGSIAAASGFDKETARRKLLRLTADRILVRSEQGSVTIDQAFVRQPSFVAIMRRHLAEVARLANAFGARGVVARDALAGSRSGGHDALANAACGPVARNVPGGSSVEQRQSSQTAVCLQPVDIVGVDTAWWLALSLLASMHRSFAAYRKVAGNIDYVLILLAVIAITAQHLTKSDLEEELHDLKRALPRDRLALCNVSSIAAAAGLPLETTRRKTLELIARGSLERDLAGNVQFTPGILQQPIVYDLTRNNAAEAVALADRLERLGLLVYDCSAGSARALSLGGARALCSEQ